MLEQYLAELRALCEKLLRKLNERANVSYGSPVIGREGKRKAD
jgi:hypothetical protein